MQKTSKKIESSWKRLLQCFLDYPCLVYPAFDYSVTVFFDILLLISVLNDEFVEQFAALNIELTTSDIDDWFQADGPGYEHTDEQG